MPINTRLDETSKLLAGKTTGDVVV